MKKVTPTNTPRDMTVCNAIVKTARLNVPEVVRYHSMPPMVKVAMNGMTCQGDLNRDIAAIRMKKP